MNKFKISIVVWLIILVVEMLWYGKASGLNSNLSYFDRTRASCTEKHGDDITRVNACVDSEYLVRVHNTEKTHNVAVIVLIFVVPGGLIYYYIKECKRHKDR